jgi:hypothetical protein
MTSELAIAFVRSILLMFWLFMTLGVIVEITEKKHSWGSAFFWSIFTTVVAILFFPHLFFPLFA